MALLTFIKIRNKRTLSILFGFFILIAMSLSYGLIKGQYISESSRYELNSKRGSDEYANSILISPVTPNTWYGETVSIVYGFFSVNLPLNGFKHILKPHIIAFVIWQFLFFVIIFIRYGHGFKFPKKNNYELWLFYFLFSFFIVQGIFEPDLGSAIRHKAGVFPLIYYLMYYEELREKFR